MKRVATTRGTALLGAAVGLAFAAILLGPGAAAGDVPARGDLADFFWPMKAYTASRQAAGEIALWNPLAGCGEPWLAQLQSGALDPLGLPFLLGRAAGPNAAIALLLVVSASGMAAWLASLRVSRAGALLGAAVYTGGGAFLSLALVYNNFATAALLPWLFYGARRAVRGPSAAAFGAAVALAFLGGEPALATAGTIAAAAVAVLTRREDAEPPSSGRAAARAAFGALLGVGLAAAALAPFAALVADAGRLTSVSRAEALARAVGPADLVDLVLPPLDTRSPAHGRGGYLATLALAPLPFVLAAASGSGLAARPRLLAALVVLALFGLLLSLGERGALVPLLWDAGLRGVRFPARWFVFAHLALGAFAAAGLDGWRDGHLVRWPKRTAFEGEPPGKTPLIVSAVAGLGIPAALFAVALPPGRPLGVAAWAALAAGAGGVLVLLLLRVSSVLPHRSAGLLLVELVALPLPLATRDVFAGVPAADLARPPRVLADVAPGAPGRVFPVVADGALLRTWLGGAGAAWSPETARRAHEAAAGYTAPSVGIASATSPSPIGNPRRARVFAAALSGGDAKTLLGLLDVRRVVTPFPAGFTGARLERRSGAVLRYALDGGAGRVFFPRETVEADDDAAFAALRAPGFDPERALVAPGEGALPPRRPEKGFAVAKVTRDEPEAFALETSTSAPSVLVVTRAWDRGWTAEVDGAASPVRRCDLALLGVVVPAGEHRVTFTYRPLAFRAGAAVSVASLLVLAGLVLAGGKEPPP